MWRAPAARARSMPGARSGPKRQPMRTHGSRPRRPRFSADAAIAVCVAAALAGAWAVARAEEPLLARYEIVGDAIPAPLTGQPGDAARGRAIVVNRRVGLCLLCHSGPFAEERFQGTIGPDLAGAGSRWSDGQLRLRLVDPARLNPATIMPPYYRVAGLNCV